MAPDAEQQAVLCERWKQSERRKLSLDLTASLLGEIESGGHPTTKAAVAALWMAAAA